MKSVLTCVLIMASPLTAFGQVDVKLDDRMRVLRTDFSPDQAVCVLSQKPFRYLLVDRSRTALMQGLDFKQSKPVRVVLAPSNKKGAYDENYAGIGGIAQINNKTISVFHAEKQSGRVNEFGTPKFYATIGVAVHTKGNDNIQKLGPAISCWKLENPNFQGTAQGSGDPSMLIDHTGEWLFCYYTDHARTNPSNKQKRSVITCMARCRVQDEGTPGSWRKYYEGKFSEPGLGGKDTEVANCWAPHVTYIESLKKYVMVGSRGGMVCYFSDDGIHWSDVKRLWNVADIPQRTEFAQHPALIIRRTDSKSATGELLFRYSKGITNNTLVVFASKTIRFEVK